MNILKKIAVVGVTLMTISLIVGTVWGYVITVPDEDWPIILLITPLFILGIGFFVLWWAKIIDELDLM